MKITHSETNCLPLKMDGWKMNFFLGWSNFRMRTVSFRECMSPQKRDHLERTHFYLPTHEFFRGVESLVFRGSKLLRSRISQINTRHFWRFGSDVSVGINTTMLYNFPTWLVLKDQTSRNQKRQALFFGFPWDLYTISEDQWCILCHSDG